MKNKKKSILLFIALSFVAIYLRLYHIEFGLPHSFHADEPEIVELAIKYTYEIRDVIKNNDWYKLIPISYVYGTFPTYLLTLATMGYSKLNRLIGITFEKIDIYIFLRTLTALTSLIIIPASAFLYKKLFEDDYGSWITAILVALNWKLIVHAHYVNMDIYLTTLIILSLVTMYLYQEDKKPSLMVILSGILYGLAAGTKITALLTFPLYAYIFIYKKDYRSFFAFLFVLISAFFISNPFSILFPNDFVFRIFSMLTKEGGLVFDSVNLSYFKYITGLSFILSFPVLLLSIYGIKVSTKKKSKWKFHNFLLGQVVLYFVFYSIQNRRVDRWLLPLIPILSMYAAYALSTLKNKGKLFKISIVLVAGMYIFYIGTMLSQFSRHTPKSAAYLWMKTNIPLSANKLVYTEEGLDPINKLPGARVLKYQVYESEAAQFFVPEAPMGYDYIVISSKPAKNYNRPPVMEKHYFYFEKWDSFYKTIEDPTKFELIKSFTLPKPNLVQLSDVYIYKNLNPIDQKK